MPNTSSKKSMRKFTNAQLVAIIIAIVTGSCTVLAACVGLGVPLISSYFERTSNEQTQPDPNFFPTPYEYQLPTPAVAGKQLDFSPILLNITLQEIPNVLGLNETPHEGIYISQLWISRSGDISWMVYYKDGTEMFAQSDTCTLVKDYPEEYQAPMNLRADKAILPVTIFSANRYSLEITGAKITVTDYSPPRTDVDYLQPFRPGGGGSGPGWVQAPYAVFLPVQTDEILVKPKAMAEYKVDFKWFNFQPEQGVEIDIPVKMAEPGTYQFQVEITAIATNNSNNQSENIKLTTGRDSYTWAKIDDPRNYDVYLFRDDPPISLELCP
ncbi:MAG: hypothetical protein PHC99_11335 [Methylococcales bacterium]|nr:hypothetical protein [Methylococcales bacterium]